MARGIRSSIAKKYGISKKGWIEEKKARKGKSRSKSKTKKKKSVRTRGIRSMAKKKGKRRYKMTIPIAPVIGLGVGMMPAIDHLLKGDITNFFHRLSENYVGWNPGNNRFEIEGLKRGILPLVVGLLVHKFVGGSLGLNRMLGRAKVPLLRL